MVERAAPRKTKDKRVNQKREFIGVDGEGVSRPDGRHEYVLLSIGDKSLYYPDGRRLTFYDIIPFLWECFLEKPEAVYVGFYLGYDFTHWFRDLPENRARYLFTNEGIARRKRTKSGGNTRPFAVEHRGWCFDLLGLKRLRLWQCRNHNPEPGHKCETSSRLYICDTGPFFQTSFLNVIEPIAKKWPDGALLSDVEYSKLERGKGERGFSLEHGTPLPPELIEYNVLENEILGRLITKYDIGLRNVGVKLRKDQWFGPGQAAQSFLNRIKAPTRETFERTTDVAIRTALRNSYYGGWFEIFAHGHIPGVSWEYDINSAYPDIQSNLPCVLHGEWTGGKSDSPSGKYCLIYGTIRGSNQYIGPAPLRLKSGNIIRPKRVRGWYWLHEIDAARRAGLVDAVEIEQWISYVACDCEPPYRELRTLYRDRLRVKKNSVGGKARRLIYNSTYGKTAQSIGEPKFANPFYASLITSFCRTYILNAIATHPIGASDVLMVATDGVTFGSRHPNLEISPETLGAWDEKKHENLTLFMPGIYWNDDVRNKQISGTSASLKSRGIPAIALMERITEIDEAFSDTTYGTEWPTFDIPITFDMLSPKQALIRDSWFLCGHVSSGTTKTINSDPISKRNADACYYDERGLLRCPIYDLGDAIETIPYRKAFGDEQQKEMMSLLTPDGEIMEQFIHALKGE
jgi:hypothetical protein